MRALLVDGTTSPSLRACLGAAVQGPQRLTVQSSDVVSL